MMLAWCERAKAGHYDALYPFGPKNHAVAGREEQYLRSRCFCKQSTLAG